MSEPPPPQRPVFAEAFPRTPELDALVQAFVAGDYASVRRGARGLPSDAPEDVRRAARELEERTRADPLAKTLFALTAVLLVVLSSWWLAHSRPAPTPPPLVEHVR